MTVHKTASNAHLWTQCGGYVKVANDFIAKYGRHESIAADEGILAHRLAEMLLRHMTITGDTDPDVPTVMDGHLIPVDMRIKTLAYARHCHRLINNAGTPRYDHIFIEQEMPCTFLSENLTIRVDYAFYNRVKKHLTVIDLKYGHRQVHAEGNSQLVICAHAIMDELKKDGFYVESVDLCIYQPNGPTAYIPLDTWRTEKDVIEISGTALKALYDYDGGDLIPGRHCYHCDGRAACEAVDLALYESWDVMARYSGKIKHMPVERIEMMLAELEKIKTLVRGYETGLEALAISKLKKGEKFSKWEYTSSLSNRKWAYTDAEIISLGKSMNLDLEKKTVISPKQAELMGMKKDIVDTLTKRESTGLKLRKKSLKTLKQAFN